MGHGARGHEKGGKFSVVVIPWFASHAFSDDASVHGAYVVLDAGDLMFWEMSGGTVPGDVRS
jgi:hypothetical protein